MKKYSVVITACPNKKTANKLSGVILKKRLAACVQILPIESTYTWKGKIERTKEFLLLMKTKTSVFKKIKEEILKNHPYDLPEVMSLPVQNGSTAYFSWIDKNTR